MTRSNRKYTIGRAPTCDIVLADDSVSRIHAELAFLEDGGLLVTDCRSTQGTFLLRAGGTARALRQERVSPQDALHFGSVSMPVAELLRALNLKHPAAVAPQPAEGEKLARCGCGAVKLVNQRCGVCGV